MKYEYAYFLHVDVQIKEECAAGCGGGGRSTGRANWKLKFGAL